MKTKYVIIITFALCVVWLVTDNMIFKMDFLDSDILVKEFFGKWSMLYLILLNIAGYYVFGIMIWVFAKSLNNK